MAGGSFITMELGDVNVYDDYEARLLAPGEDLPRWMDDLVDKIMKLAQRYAPFKTGVLRGSADAGRSGDDWFVRFYAHYALYVEMGHRIMRNHRQVGYVPPNPYLRPALDEVMAETHV